MNVRELIEQLESCDPDMEVRIDTPTHDYWRTHIASKAQQVNEVECFWTEYHRAYQLPKDGETDEGDAEHPNKTFVVLS